MEEIKTKIIGITDKMEIHLHGNTEKKEFYTNINISEILNILEEFTYNIGDLEENEMLAHLSTYFYDKI